MNETMQKTLDFKPALEQPDLVGPTVTHLLHHWHGTISAKEILVAQIDPLFAGGSDFCAKYQIPVTQGCGAAGVGASSLKLATLEYSLITASLLLLCQMIIFAQISF